MQFNLTCLGTFNFKRYIKELLHPIITDALSDAILTIFVMEISFLSKQFLNFSKILFAEQSVASKHNNSNNYVATFLFKGKT